MAYGQPFYNYGSNPYGGQNNGFMAQQPQYGNFYGQPQNAPQNANNGVVQQFQQQQPTTMPPKTNIAPVTSLMDALNRTVEPNTNLYYADQDNPLIYLVSTDMQGRKTSRTFKIEDVTEQTTAQASQPTANIDLSDYVKKEDLQAFKDEIMKIANAFVAQQVGKTKQSEQKAKVEEKPKKDKE